MGGNEIETSQVFALRDGLDGLHIGGKLAINFELGEHAEFYLTVAMLVDQSVLKN